MASNKNILLCFDGSGNEPKMYGTYEGDHVVASLRYGITNVLKIHLLAGGSAITDDDDYADVDGQHSIYVSGVGVRVKVNLLFGYIKVQTEEMLEKLEKVYRKGDRLFLFGFSRGAASAREFVSIVNSRGIKCLDNKFASLTCRRYTGSIYEERDKNPIIKFMGLFDCVSRQVFSLSFFKGIAQMALKRGVFSPRVLGEKEGKMADNVERALHLVGLDDPRMYGSHGPTLLGQIDDKFEEIWMPGTHGDTGGAWYDKDLGDVALKYMLDCVEEHGEGIKFKKAPFNFNKQTIDFISETSAFQDFNNYMTLKSLDQKTAKDAVNWENKFKQDKASYRVIGTWKNNEFHEDGLVTIHESAYVIFDSIANAGQDIYTQDTPYNINLLPANFQIIDNEGNISSEKTEKLKQLLQDHGPKE